MCERCDAIRLQASLILALTFKNQPVMNIMQTVACMNAILRHAAISDGEEAKFKELWDMMTEEEFKYACLTNPIEPVKFDDKFDLRDHLKGKS